MSSIRSKNNRYKNNNNDEHYSVFLKHVKEEKEETSAFAKTLLVLILIVGAIITFFMFFVNDPQTIESIFGKNSIISQKLIDFMNSRNSGRGGLSLPFLPRRQNVLLLGVDANGSKTDPWTGARSDTIVVMNIDPKTHSVNAISVPRDSKVFISGNSSVQKINAAHAIGGVDMTKRTVEETLGIKIDRYIEVSDQAVENLVNTLGGVPIYVEQNMSYDDNSGHLHVHLRKGNALLDGKNAVGYLRFRHDGLGDIGRTQRQQWFLRSLLEKMQSPQAIPKIPDMINIAKTYVKTDMSLLEMSQYAAMAKSFDKSKIEVATLPGSPNKRGSVSYWILDPDKTQQVVNRMIYREHLAVDPKTFVGGILYTPSKETTAYAIKNSLEAQGFKVNMVRRRHLPHSQFVAETAGVTNDFFLGLKTKIPQLSNDEFVYDPNQFYSPSNDFTIIVSGQ
jgi:LCP family protein required for cell wall assembly